jgi:acetyl esterase
MTELAEPAAPVPHEEVRRYFSGAEPQPPPWTRSISELRRETRNEALAVRGRLEPVAAVEELTIAGVPARLYRPARPAPSARVAGGAQPGRPAPGVSGALVWVHGGGWMHGDLDCYDNVARALANRAQCAVLAVAYRLAPEHPFPAGFDDVWTAIEWAAEHFGPVAVAGDSSGGNLAAAAALKARDLGIVLAAQVLVYPVLESHMNTLFKSTFRTRYASFLNRPGYGAETFDRISYIWDSYVPEQPLRDCAYVSPVHAGTLRGVAPAMIITAEHDILRWEAQEYAQRLRADGVHVAQQNYEGQIHGFFQMLGVMSDAQHAISVAAEYVSRELARLVGSQLPRARTPSNPPPA